MSDKTSSVPTMSEGTPEDFERLSRIQKEEKRLRGAYPSIGAKRKRVIDGLIRRAAYMRITLEDYEEDLTKNGSVELFTQSENVEPYERERPVARLYNTMNKNYQSIIKQLSDSLPQEVVKKKTTTDQFGKFVQGRDDNG